MTEKAISPLRRRMIEDMTVRNFVEKTKNDYVRHVKSLAFLGRSPDTAAPEDLRRFQLHQAETGVRPPTINGSVAALRCFFTVTLDRPEMARHPTFVREPRRVPIVMSPEEVARFLEAAPGPKWKAALSAAYAADVLARQITLVPRVPVGLDLAPHAADRVFADGAAEEGRQRTADTTRIATGEIATGDQSFDLLRAPSIGWQRLVLPLGRFAVGGVEPGARHGDRDRTEGAHQFALAIAMGGPWRAQRSPRSLPPHRQALLTFPQPRAMWS